MFIFFVLALVLCVLVWRGIKKKVDLNLPPVYPGGLPILGHAHLLRFWADDTKGLWSVCKEISEVLTALGGVARISVALADYIIISDPEDIITAANACLDKNYCYQFPKCWLGNGLLTGNAEIWKRHRKLLNPAFNQQVIDSFLSIFIMQSKKLIQDLVGQVGKGYFRHHPYLNNIALDSIYQTAIGINIEDEPKLNKTAFTNAEATLLKITAQRVQKFWMHFEGIFKYCSLKQKQDEAVKVISDTYDIVMDIKKSTGIKEQQKGKKIKTFLDLLLDLAADGSLTNKEVWDEVNTIIVAGHDTIGITLTNLLMYLGSYPEVQDKVFEELREVFEDKTRDVQKKDLPKLVYLDAVIKESLRMYPVAPVALRYAARDVKLKNHVMPAGTNCVLLMHGLHRHPMWGEDKDEFRPERWFGSSVQMNNAFAGFGLGKRNCIGKTYGMMFMKTALAHLLRRYRVTSDISKLQMKFDVVLKPTSGDLIAIEERNY